MTTTPLQTARLKFNRPSLRKHARPPKQRSSLGQAFTNANLGGTFLLQHCADCGTAQYPSRELCEHCLGGQLQWREANNHGRIIGKIALHHSLWEYFKRRISKQPWTMASIKLEAGPIVFAHLASDKLSTADAVKLFTYRDSSLNSVIIAVAKKIGIETPQQRRELANALALTTPAIREGGL